MGGYLYASVFLGLLASMSMMQAFGGGNDLAVCNPNSPIVVEQSSVKLFSMQGGDGEEQEMMAAMSGLMGDPILRISNITEVPQTVTVDLRGDGFLIKSGQMEGPANGPTSTFTLPAGSTVVLPLIYQPSMTPDGETQEGPSGENIVVGEGMAWVTIEGERYTDYFNQVYLVGLSVLMPSDTSDTSEPAEMPEIEL